MTTPPATPRLAATVLLVRDDPFEVLMVRRTERKADTFSSALVFPGGVVDPEDRADDWLPHIASTEKHSAEERALRIAACRETFEEAGVLLARDAHGAHATTARQENGQSFLQMVAALKIRLDLDGFVHFAHWITPPISPRRFDTHFYLCAAPAGVQAICDGGETVALEWVCPRAMLDLAPGAILFPTRCNLRRLAESHDTRSALAAARARAHFTVVPNPEQRDGRTVITIPEAAGYGVTDSLQR